MFEFQDPESLDALQEIQFTSKKDSTAGDLSPHRGSKGGTLLRFISNKGSAEPSFSSYLTDQAGEAAPSRWVLHALFCVSCCESGL